MKIVNIDNDDEKVALTEQEKQLASILWNVARQELCVTKLNANCIVMVTHNKIGKIAKALMAHEDFKKLLDSH